MSDDKKINNGSGSEAEEQRSKRDLAFEEFLRSIDGDEDDAPRYYEAPQHEKAEDKSENYADTGAEKFDNTQVISDEELAKLLNISTDELRVVTGEDAGEADGQLESTQVFREPVSEDGGEAGAFKAEHAGPGGEDIDRTHVFHEVADAKPVKKEKKQAEKQYQSEEEDYDARDYRPVRRRRNYRTGCMGGVLYFIMVVCVSTVLAALCWLAANDVLSLNKEEVSAEITVSDNFTIDEVANELKQAGIIEYPFLFKLFSKFSNADEKIDPGVYEISSNLDYRAIVTNLQRGAGAMVTVSVTIPEGKTMMQTFEILEENKVCTVDELVECATNHDFDYRFLDSATLGSEKRLEGFLFPDTYEFYEYSSPESAIKKFLDNFDRKVGDDMYAKAEVMGYSFNEVLTIASMIEMEAASDSERPTIASVIYNRLHSSDFSHLQIDATVQYALGERKEKLSYEDLQVDSPYNTYLYEGLPPGPISNPGLASIKAALDPENTNYYYYALNKSGNHEFFTYYSSFEEFVNGSDFGG